MKKNFILFLTIIAVISCVINSTVSFARTGNDNLNDKKDLFGDYYQKARTKMNKMTTKEKVGQLFLAQCNGKTAVSQIKKYQLGGVVLFAVDFQNKTKADVRKTITTYQKTAKTPMMIAVDEEGGTVVRVSSCKYLRKTRFQSPQKIYQLSGWQGIKNDIKEKTVLLGSLGINVNLAPVADVTTDPSNFIYPRSFGKDGKETAKFIKYVVQNYNANQYTCTLKHFPGYGGNLDTHTGMSEDKRTLEQLEGRDLLPFQAGIDAKAPIVMVSHNIYNAYDGNTPASLSGTVHEYLRKNMRFTGIIMTDSLSMGAITKYKGQCNPYVQAVLAGNDMICTSQFQSGYEAILKAVENKTISMKRLNESVIRILAWKYSRGLLK